MLVHVGMLAAAQLGWRVTAFSPTSLVLKASCRGSWIASVLVMQRINCTVVGTLARKLENRDVFTSTMPKMALSDLLGQLLQLLHKHYDHMLMVRALPVPFACSLTAHEYVCLAVAVASSRSSTTYTVTALDGTAWSVLGCSTGPKLISLLETEVIVSSGRCQYTSTHTGVFCPSRKIWTKPPNLQQAVEELAADLTCSHSPDTGLHLNLRLPPAPPETSVLQRLLPFG